MADGPDGHDGRQDISAVADRIWYPIWDSGVGLDHSARTVDEAVAVSDRDLRSALGLLDARHVAGDEALARQLLGSVRSRWRTRSAARLPELQAAVVERWARCGEVAFLLEPNLKQGRGGLRDMQALRALSAAAMLVAPGPRVQSAHAVLLDVRPSLPRSRPDG